MPEKFTRETPEHYQFNEEYFNLLSRAKQNLEALSRQERERLAKFGYHYLDIEKNERGAMNAFKALQDFEGLRKVVKQLLCEGRDLKEQDSYALVSALISLEDHDGIRDLLNRKDVKFGEDTYETAFEPLDQLLYEYIRKFLQENKTPIATGIINRGIDLIAIRNLAQSYDIAVPIARGGLRQGAIANLWGMPTRIVDIAAHGRKKARGKWVNPVSIEDFKGKRVLLFDKDAISGATIQKAVSMLNRFQTKNIGVYFAYPVLEPGTVGVGTRTQGLPEGIEIFSPENVSMERAGNVYIEAHERLETLYGRRRKIKDLFIKHAEKLQEKFPELADAFRKFADEHARAFDSLNPNLAGISEVRERILRRMNMLYQNYQGYLDSKMYDLPGVAENIKQILDTAKPLPFGFESKLINARYAKQGEQAAQRRNIENPHYPSNPLAAFSAARKAVKQGFDIALIVGPEGFAYEPYFIDLGVPTIAVNIPESRENEPRTIKLLEDLAAVKDKKVLVVEDDVRTGATLQKILEHLQPHNPASLGLYLGQPAKFQKVKKIPHNFEKTYIAEYSETQAKEFCEHLESRGLKIFKTTKAQE